MAHVETPSPSPLETCLPHHVPVRNRSFALGGQLRSFVRLHLRLPNIVRPDAFRDVRIVRSAKEDRFNLGLFALGWHPLHRFGTTVLHYTGLRLQTMLLL